MSVGKIEPFDLVKNNWDSYIERLEQYFVANDVKPTLKVATLITVVGSEAYDLMVNLCTPNKPSQKSYEDLVSVMKDHLQPRPSILAERFKFRRRFQNQHESIADYVTDLKRLSKDCCFSSENFKENLRDQFVCGLASESIRQRLFVEDNITFDMALKLVITMEAAEADAALVRISTKGSSLTAVQGLQKVTAQEGLKNNAINKISTRIKNNTNLSSGAVSSGASNSQKNSRNWLSQDTGVIKRNTQRLWPATCGCPV